MIDPGRSEVAWHDFHGLTKGLAGLLIEVKGTSADLDEARFFNASLDNIVNETKCHVVLIHSSVL